MINENNTEIRKALTALLNKRDSEFYPICTYSIMEKFPPRRILELTSKIQEGVLQSKEPEKGGWQELSTYRLIYEMVIELGELLVAVQNLEKGIDTTALVDVLLECADVQNYVTMIQDKMLNYPFDRRGM